MFVKMVKKIPLLASVILAIWGFILAGNGFLAFDQRYVFTVPLANGLELSIDQPSSITIAGEGSIRLEVSNLRIAIPGILRANPNWDGVVMESRLDMSGMQILPPNVVSQSVTGEDKLVFHWRLLPRNEAAGEGTLWVWMRGVKNGSRLGENQVLLGRPISINQVPIWQDPSWVLMLFGLFLAGIAIFFILFLSYRVKK